MLIPKKNRREVYKYLFKGKLLTVLPVDSTCRLFVGSSQAST
jgi:hypothetical protein